MPNLLLLHGNGGASTRFQPFIRLLRERGPDGVEAIIPRLPGFEGRPLPDDKSWEPFIRAIQETIGSSEEQEWILYGHGIGGSLLLEWASWGYPLADGQTFQPEKVILHGIIGASLEHRLFPKLMQPMAMRRLIQGLVATPLLQPVWEKRLFQSPEAIPAGLRRQFFRDYKTCAAFSLFFDLITPHWYRQVQRKLAQNRFHFIWGNEERVVASRFLKYWERDFPNSRFDIVDGWDHFPMLDQPEAFYDKIISLV